ncbi:MAG: sialate O-acetylesterase [Bacteroides sp.]
MMIPFYRKSLLALAALAMFNANIRAEVSLPAVFTDNMVLQQKSNVPVWGWGTASETLKIVGSWATQDTVKVEVAPDGSWKTTLPTASAGGPYTLQVMGSSTRTLRNVMLGEVWLCSGQSNMEWKASYGLVNKDQEIADATYPDIRFFTAKLRGALQPQNNCEGQWEVCSPEVMSQTSAIAYFFGRQLYKTLQVPVGLIVSAWGGTPAEVWVPQEKIEQHPALCANKPTQSYPWWPIESGRLYNQMIHPFMPYRIAGTIWYQGESNQDRYRTYHAVMKELIESWRKGFGTEFPFYFVQIAPHTYGAKDNGPALLREQQELTTTQVTGTGMVVISDLVNDVRNIHPIDKQHVGLRLANMALANDYGLSMKGVYSPTFESITFEKNKAIIRLKHAEEGLLCKQKKITGFKIASADGNWIDATVKIAGNTLVVLAPKLKRPTQVTYCFDEATIGNLFSKEGLPVAPFNSNRKF